MTRQHTFRQRMESTTAYENFSGAEDREFVLQQTQRQSYAQAMKWDNLPQTPWGQGQARITGQDQNDLEGRRWLYVSKKSSDWQRPTHGGRYCTAESRKVAAAWHVNIYVGSTCAANYTLYNLRSSQSTVLICNPVEIYLNYLELILIYRKTHTINITTNLLYTTIRLLTITQSLRYLVETLRRLSLWTLLVLNNRQDTMFHSYCKTPMSHTYFTQLEQAQIKDDIYLVLQLASIYKYKNR